MTQPAIYCFVNRRLPDRVVVAALADDGTLLATTEASTATEGAKAIGAVGMLPEGHSHHRTFAEHYGDGYRVEWVSDAAFPKHPGVQAALRRQAGVEIADKPTKAPW